MIRVLLTMACLSACTPLTNDHLHVRHDGAVLPVQVRGNMDAGTLMLYETGGPFGGGLEERVLDYQEFSHTLEPHLGVAYYDRRGYGNAYGDYRPEDLSLGAYVSDIDAILRTLDERYAPTTVVLMGHSWGGLITARYLLDHGSPKVDGWISVSGALVTGGDDAFVPYRRDFVCRLSADQASSGDSRADWAAMLDWCEAHPTVDPDSSARDELWDFLDEVYDIAGDPPIEVGPLLGAVFGSAYNITDSLLTPNEISRRMFEETREMDLMGELSGIDVPTLLVSGEFDDIVPSEVAVDAASRIPGAQTVEVPAGAHYVTIPDPQPLADATLAFVDEL